MSGEESPHLFPGKAKCFERKIRLNTYPPLLKTPAISRFSVAGVFVYIVLSIYVWQNEKNIIKNSIDKK